MNKLVLATSNLGKLEEAQRFFKDQPIHVVPQSQFGVTDAAETGLTFVENAIIKARHAAEKTRLPALSDDSGLVVDALEGAPGIYSARYAGDHVSAEAHIAKLLDALRDIPFEKRTARFQCAIVLMQHALDPTPIICEGTWEGFILFETKGLKGHGYDPIFYVPTHHCSAAELTVELKNEISHRGQALRQLMQKVRIA